MSGMLCNASKFNQPLSNWNTNKVTDMSSMFEGATLFNQELNTVGAYWNTGNVKNMSSMFKDCSYFNKNIYEWDVSEVTKMDSMFENTVYFNADISGWNVGAVTSMNNMFKGTSDFNINLSGWNVSNVTSFTDIFTSALGISVCMQPIINNSWAVNNNWALPIGWTTTACTNNNSANITEFGTEVGSIITNLAASGYNKDDFKDKLNYIYDLSPAVIQNNIVILNKSDFRNIYSGAVYANLNDTVNIFNFLRQLQLQIQIKTRIIHHYIKLGILLVYQE